MPSLEITVAMLFLGKQETAVGTPPQFDPAERAERVIYCANTPHRRFACPVCSSGWKIIYHGVYNFGAKLREPRRCGSSVELRCAKGPRKCPEETREVSINA